MFQSNAYEKRLRKIRVGAPPTEETERRRREERIAEEIKTAFVASLGFLPEPMQAELFDFFSRKYRAAADSYTVEDAHFLGEVIDLFTGAYNEQTDPFDAEDWEFVKDIVDENALELDMHTVNYVMKLVVDKGVL
ncbi:MAG: hypothetical protein ACLFUM_02140 [Spirochaetaceae bacterium]